MPTGISTALVLLPMLFTSAASAAENFFATVKVGERFNVVVDEPAFEARSIGSFAVRVYDLDNTQPGDETTFFLGGLVAMRDGAVSRVEVMDLDGDGSEELVVVAQSAGSGGYLSAYAIGIDDGGMPNTLAAAEGLAPDADVVAELRKAMP